MAVAVKTMRSDGDDEITEAEAINFRIQSGKDSWLLPLIIESDAQKVVNTVNGKASGSNEIFGYYRRFMFRNVIKDMNPFNIQFRPRAKAAFKF